MVLLPMGGRSRDPRRVAAAVFLGKCPALSPCSPGGAGGAYAPGGFVARAEGARNEISCRSLLGLLGLRRFVARVAPAGPAQRIPGRGRRRPDGPCVRPRLVASLPARRSFPVRR